ncbi:hypothetical protein MJG53_011541 [Ovis ammon polii x Ovis aries]|uniref:Uncharacterized protein n=1 Tax=Ovis ammon polii x Ovis aries TaxID=2918886 RepID=A0ACB9UNX4_9CETA|nr:hypothetical protein MJG53_011541 [Ovis ammon polii x Ovis aries]
MHSADERVGRDEQRQHYPKQSFTTVADTPENLRLKQQSELQSQVKYKRDFEESKGRGFSIVTDTPELQRLKRTQEQISNVGDHLFSDVITLTCISGEKVKLDNLEVFLLLVKMRVPVFEDVKDETEEEKTGEEENEEDKVFFKPVIEDLSMELARRCTELISDIHYKEEYKKSKGKCTFVTDTPMLNHVKHIGAFISEAKYKGTIKADLSNSLYKQMPATIDSVFAREVTQLQSEIAYRQKHDAAKGVSDYAHMKEPPEIQHAMEVTKHQSNAEYKKGQGVMNKEPAVIGRPDFEHAVEASKLSSQIKYKEKFDNEMKDKKHLYNPLESASFRQSQLATALASDVKYKKDFENMHDPVSGLPDLFLDHALKVSKMLSGREYRKVFEENKGLYHFDVDAAEHLHHKGNAMLQSQVKYKEAYEKNKGKSMLEFVETPSYQVSKEAQKMQSEKVYREDFEKDIKGRSSMDLDKTPEFLHVKYITNLLKEKEYKKDLENEIKGKGMELNSEVLDIQRAKRASEMTSEKEYKKDLESEIKGKGMQVGTDTLGIQHAKRASEIASEKDYKRDLETEIRGKGMQVSTDTLDIQRAKKASEMASQKEYKKDLENEIKGKGMQVSMDIPDMLRAKRASEIYSQVFYKKEVGAGTAVKDTPEIERVKKNQQNISSVKYTQDQKQMKGRPSLILDTPGLRHVKEAQNHISMVKYHEDFEKTKGRGFTPVVDDPVTERVRRNTQVVSDAAYKGVHPHIVEMDRRPGIIVAPVLPGAYQQSHSQGYGYMHQTSLSSVRSMQHSPNLRTYRAMYDYSAQDEDEVSFRDGDYIVNVQPIDDGWMYGTVQRTGKTGMLPANYIEFVN